MARTIIKAYTWCVICVCSSNRFNSLKVEWQSYIRVRCSLTLPLSARPEGNCLPRAFKRSRTAQSHSLWLASCKTQACLRNMRAIRLSSEIKIEGWIIECDTAVLAGRQSSLEASTLPATRECGRERMREYSLALVRLSKARSAGDSLAERERESTA